MTWTSGSVVVQRTVTAPPPGVATLWHVDLRNLAGGAVVSDLPVRSLSATWALDGPGSIEIDVGEDYVTGLLYGQRRIILRRDTTVQWQGWHLGVGEDDRSWDDIERPGGANLQLSGLGLASILENRFVHGDFSKTNVVATTIAWDLIAHAQAQPNGNHGFAQGPVFGTAPSRTRHFCDGDSILEAIQELAEKTPGGFNWEIDQDGNFNTWVGGRGAASGQTVSRPNVAEWSVRSDTSQLASYATALGPDPDECGPPLEIRSDATLVTAYGRREVVVETNNAVSGELIEDADEAIRSRSKARLRVTFMYRESKPLWAWRAVWLGDTMTVNLPAHYGGNQTMRVIRVTLSVEPPAFGFIEYEMEIA